MCVAECVHHYSLTSARAACPLPMYHEQIGQTAAFLCSPLASAITGQVMFVDNGLGNMGLAVNSKTFDK